MLPSKTLERTTAVAFVGLAILMASLPGYAAPGGGVGGTTPPINAPGPKVDLPARIVSVKRVPPRGGVLTPYTGGALTYAIEVAAPTTKALASNVVVKSGWRGTVVSSIPVAAAAGARATITGPIRRVWRASVRTARSM